MGPVRAGSVSHHGKGELGMNREIHESFTGYERGMSVETGGRVHAKEPAAANRARGDYGQTDHGTRSLLEGGAGWFTTAGPAEESAFGEVFGEVGCLSQAPG